MIKKSDVQALLDTLPDEFQLADLRSLADRFEEAPPLTQAQKEAVVEAAERARIVGSNPVEDVEKRIQAWAASSS